MPAPSLSVIVPTRGGASRLPVLLDALAAQELDEPWEVVFVLDGDIDGSSAVVDMAAEDLPVRRMTFDSNRGRSAALNAGFAESSGRVMVRCDDDLVPGPDFLSRHLAAHADREVGVVGLYRNIYPETTYARVYGRAWDLRFRKDAYRVPPDGTWRYWAGNVSVRRDVWERVGPYDTAVPRIWLGGRRLGLPARSGRRAGRAGPRARDRAPDRRDDHGDPHATGFLLRRGPTTFRAEARHRTPLRPPLPMRGSEPSTRWRRSSTRVAPSAWAQSWTQALASCPTAWPGRLWPCPSTRLPARVTATVDTVGAI